MHSEATEYLKCSHENIQDDNGEGNSVCLECGQVLDDIYTYNHTYVTNQTEKELYLNNKNEIHTKNLKLRSAEIELVKTLKDKWFFPNIVIEDTIELFLQLCNTEKEEKNIHCFKKTLFAFAFFKALEKQNCSHSISEICILFDIPSIKYLSKLGFTEKIEMQNNIFDFLNRFSNNLNLNFKQKKQVFHTLKNMKKIPPNIKPETICGLIILNHHLKEPLNCSLKSIAKNCEISYQTLVKNHKKHKNIF